MTWSLRWRLCVVAVSCALPTTLWGQVPDTATPYTLPPTTVSVTRARLPLTKVPLSIHNIDRQQISRARPTWGLDEALRSEEHTSELQSQSNLVCRLLL